MDLALLDARAAFYSMAWPTRALLDYVKEHALDLDRITAFAGATGIIDVVDCGQGRFDWAAPGPTFPAFICEAYSEDGETSLDLVSWPIDRPAHVLSMFGRAPILGLWAALNPATYFLGKALDMHRTPLDWLRAGCTGAAIVDPRQAARLYLDIPGPIAARDRSHARHLLAIARTVVDEKQFVFPTEPKTRAA